MEEIYEENFAIDHKQKLFSLQIKSELVEFFAKNSDAQKNY